MKKAVLLLSVIVFPPLVFAGGYGGGSFLPTTKTKAPATSAYETVEPVVSPSVTSRSTARQSQIELIEPQNTITRERYNPYYIRYPQTNYNPTWWLTRNSSDTVNRNTESINILRQKESRAQSKLLKYRSFMR